MYFSVLPEPNQSDYITTTLTPASYVKSDLDPMLGGSPRYTDTNAYYPNNWGTNATYPSTYNYNYPTNNNQQYTTPPVFVYPHLYSTVNQNQIHVHLHGDKLDQYLNQDTLALPAPRNPTELTLVPPGEAQLTAPSQEDDRNDAGAVTDPSSVWRPY